MKPSLLPWMAAAATCFLTNCTLFKSTKSDPAEKKPPSEGPNLVGRIASIPADKRFVVIQSYESSKIEVGTILTTRGAENRTANLVATGESQGQFTAADVQSGSVEIGDAVYSRHAPKLPSATEEMASPPQPIENQQNKTPENVQTNN